MIIFPFQTKTLKKDLKVEKIWILPFGKLKTNGCRIHAEKIKLFRFAELILVESISSKPF